MSEGPNVAPQGQTIGYVRVSSADQNLARQIDAVDAVDRLFQDKISGGSRAAREGLTECLAYIRAGDILRVASMDRLARSLIDLQQIVDEILDKDASVHFVKEGQTYTAESSDSLSRLLLQMLGAFAEFKRNLIRDRQAEGIRIAKAAGKYHGRTRALTPSQIGEARALIERGVPKTKVAAQLQVNRSTLYRALADTDVSPNPSHSLGA